MISPLYLGDMDIRRYRLSGIRAFGDLGIRKARGSLQFVICLVFLRTPLSYLQVSATLGSDSCIYSKPKAPYGEDNIYSVL